MTTRPWDLFAIQSHGIDWCNHMFVRQPGWSQEQVDAGLAHIARGYQSVDRLVGRILEAAGDDEAARTHWRRYLALDPESAWSAIARERLRPNGEHEAWWAWMAETFGFASPGNG